MKKQLIVIILTYNEAIHIERAIKNVSNFADHVIILDSYSEDETATKARSLGAEVIFRKFDNYKSQREYAIQHCRDKTEWMFFLDADEYLTEKLKIEIKKSISKKNIVGYYVTRRFIFMNKWIKWGGYYPIYLLRLFRPECASVDGIINEHIFVAGNKGYLNFDLIDHNLKDISHWIDKHNRYSSFEAQELRNFKINKNQLIEHCFPTSQNERKKWLRYKVWNKLPTFLIRPLAYFIYRYFIRLGFLDGTEGFIYHFLQAFWFWFIVDVKYAEFKNNNAQNTLD